MATNVEKVNLSSNAVDSSITPTSTQPKFKSQALVPHLERPHDNQLGDTQGPQPLSPTFLGVNYITIRFKILLQ
jgi:hypothetical protein